MKIMMKVAPVLFFMGSGICVALEDPYSRDDDISLLVVNVTHSMNENGHYVYLYDIESPDGNTGKLSSFWVDLSCDSTPDSLGFSVDDYPTTLPSPLKDNASDDGKHVPAALDAAYGQASLWGISSDNRGGWLIGLEPGDSVQELRITSPYPPGGRTYELDASIEYRWLDYDYDSVDWSADNNDLPWGDDWGVTGVIAGPACPGEEYPDDDGGERFSGSKSPEESQSLNELLVYSSPLKNQFHTVPAINEVAVTVHYSDDIDPKTFVVTPNKHGLKRLFHPAPGTSETVLVPLVPGKNRFELQVQRVFEGKDNNAANAESKPGRRGVSLDRDVFVIRVPKSPGTEKNGRAQ